MVRDQLALVHDHRALAHQLDGDGGGERAGRGAVQHLGALAAAGDDRDQPVVLDGVAGWLVTTFRLDSTATFMQDPRFGGTDGWTPGTGMGIYFGYPGANPANAYALVFVNGDDPTAATAQA